MIGTQPYRRHNLINYVIARSKHSAARRQQYMCISILLTLANNLTMSTEYSPSIVRVAVTQAEPEWLDLDKTVDKTCQLIQEAAKNNALLIAFPECWIPGYPAWVWYGSVFFFSFTYCEVDFSLGPARSTSIWLPHTPKTL